MVGMKNPQLSLLLKSSPLWGLCLYPHCSLVALVRGDYPYYCWLYPLVIKRGYLVKTCKNIELKSGFSIAIFDY